MKGDEEIVKLQLVIEPVAIEVCDVIKITESASLLVVNE